MTVSSANPYFRSWERITSQSPVSSRSASSSSRRSVHLMYSHLSLRDNQKLLHHPDNQIAEAVSVHTEASHRLWISRCHRRCQPCFRYISDCGWLSFLCSLIVCPIVKLVSDDRSGSLPAPVSRCIPVLPPFHPLPMIAKGFAGRHLMCADG